MVSMVTLLFLSCDGSQGEDLDPLEGESTMEPGYELTVGIPSGNENHQTFKGTETEWNLSSGIVVLGPEDIGEPLARLEMAMRITEENDAIEIFRAILSWSDKRTNETGPVDARLYVLSRNYNITFDAMDNAKIIRESWFTIKMDRVQNSSADPAETIDVMFKFHATDLE